MEESGSGKHEVVDRGDPVEILSMAGLSPRVAASWVKSRPRVAANFYRDSAAATKFWRADDKLIGKLPKKQTRTLEQQLAVDVI
jgi:hypothetical protein